LEIAANVAFWLVRAARAVPNQGGDMNPKIPNDDHSHSIPFFVDSEKETTTADVLTVRAILALVGEDPDEYYVVERHGNELTEYRGAETEVPVKAGAKFVTVFTGPTPVS
jgi:hypothetical protein